VDAPGDNAEVIVHEDQPVLVPVELLDGPQPFLLCGDSVISEQGVVVGEGCGDPQVALVEPLLDGFVAEAIRRIRFRPEDLAEVGLVKLLKH